MPTQCNAEQLEFSCVERRRVVAAFDGGTVSSDAGALLLGRTDAASSINWLSAIVFISKEKRACLDRVEGPPARFGLQGCRGHPVTRCGRRSRL